MGEAGVVCAQGLDQAHPQGAHRLGGHARVGHKSTALSAAHFMLAMRAEGYDTCPMEGMDSVRVKKILGLPRRSEVCMVVSAGKRTEKGVYGPVPVWTCHVLPYPLIHMSSNEFILVLHNEPKELMPGLKVLGEGPLTKRSL